MLACNLVLCDIYFFFSSRRRHTRYIGDWSSDVCSSDLGSGGLIGAPYSVERAIPVVFAVCVSSGFRSEERRVGKSVDLGGRRIIKKKKKGNNYDVDLQRQKGQRHSRTHLEEGDE